MTEKTELDNTEAAPVKEERENHANTADINNIAGALVDSQPEPQQHAIDQAASEQKEIKAAYADLRDADNNSFDPAMHVTDSDGEPKLTGTGKLRKRSGRKKGSAPNAPRMDSVIHNPKVAASNQQVQIELDAKQKATARATGSAAANLLLVVSVGLGGEEWQPAHNKDLGLHERQFLETSFADYFEATGRTDLPPAMALVVAVGFYAMPRFTMPKTQSRMSRFKNWAIAKFAVMRFGKKTPPTKEKQNNGARTNSGADTKRQDDTSKSAS